VKALDADRFLARLLVVLALIGFAVDFFVQPIKFLSFDLASISIAVGGGLVLFGRWTGAHDQMKRIGYFLLVAGGLWTVARSMTT
jgi:hypothetical protein